MNKRFIITGAPGTGKSSIINELIKRGYSCAKEISRNLISEQLNSSGEILPWKNQVAFENEIIKMRFKQYINSPQNCIYFFDRSIIDSLGYLNANKLNASSEIIEIIKKCRFNKTVFYTPIWEEIYINDHERKEDIKKAKEIEESIIKTYRRYGYNMIEVPKIPILKRADFIISKI
ncbi:MAG: hypothetical protein CMD16_04305 [Flavobacteriales bacterium]|nr:hypothetical protein [Flavobacteriales bacterium]|tara:strand:+ start:22256 stop:22783 length:528 start_codon:yes stop_codon:yes gene_type:complete